MIKDAFGNVLELQIFRDSLMVRHVKYCYDAHDNKIMETELSSQGIPIRVIEYHYRNNRLVERLIYDGNRNLKATKTYHYDTL